MGANSKIEWTHHTFNPWIGCTKVSAGCTHCYAEALSKRTGLAVWGDNGTRRITSDAYWKQPAKWAREAEAAGERRRVFCASLADVLEDRAELEAPRQRLWALIRLTAKWLDWLLVTKRIENAVRMIPADVLALIWLGVSVEDQPRADARIPLLLQTPAAVRFLSCEPLLGPLDLQYPEGVFPGGPEMCRSGHECGCQGKPCEPPLIYGIDWVIVGGESGPGARPMHPDWVLSILDQCQAAKVPFLFKQWGEFSPITRTDGIHESPFGGQAMVRVGKKAAGRLIDGRTWDEYPEVKP